MPHRFSKGVTLIEVVIAIAVLGILLGVALPSYRVQVAKARRADGRAALMAVAQRMDRFYAERGTYVGATLGSSGLYPSKSEQGHYNLSIAAQSASAYSLTAAPTGGQSGDGCGTLGYNEQGQKSVGSDATLNVALCW